MTALVWDSTSQRTYETGIQKAVINFSDIGTFPWNGLTKVDESEKNSTLVTTFFDGVKIHNQKGRGVYECKISGLSFPKEVAPILGMAELRPGFSITGQTRKPFNFTYQTLVGDSDYKIHFVWNALLVQSELGSDTIGSTTEPTKFAWDVTATPSRDNEGYHASAHMVVDSSEVSSELMSDLIDWIYGTDSIDPYFPTQPELIAFFNPPFEPELVARFNYYRPNLDTAVSEEITVPFYPFVSPVADPYGWMDTLYDPFLTCPVGMGGVYSVLFVVFSPNDNFGEVTTKLIANGVEYVGPNIEDISYSTRARTLTINDIEIDDGEELTILIDRTAGLSGALAYLSGYILITRTG